MIIQKINPVIVSQNKVHSKLNTANKINSNKLNALSFGQFDETKYGQDRALYGWGYGRQCFISREEYERRGYCNKPYREPQPEVSYDEYQDALHSSEAEKAIKKRDFVNAINEKLEVAKICRKRNRERDAYLVEEGIRELYAQLDSKIDKLRAKQSIRTYNPDMANYIDKDMENGHYYKGMLLKDGNIISI